MTQTSWKDPQEKERGHSLVTQEAIKDVHPIRATADFTERQMDREDVHFKLFSPYSNWTWYIIEYDPETGDAFGIAEGQENELGYFNVHHLATIRIAPLPGSSIQVPAIERDCYYRPEPVRAIKDRLGMV